MTTVETRSTNPLRGLYLTRFGFAIVWAVVLVISTGAGAAGSLAPLTAVLLVLYPVVDLVAAVIDRRTAGATGPSALLVLNMALSLLAAVGLLIASTTGAAPVLLVWGLWAITAGIVQLVVGVRRRAIGGQWAMILSGGISVLAGAAFAASSAGSSPSVTGLAGYAVLGGVFFLVSALRQHRVETAAR